MGGARTDIFPIFDNGDFSRLESVDIPALAFYGGNEDTLVHSARKDLEIIASRLKNQKSKTLIIPGADHTYFEKEETVAQTIADWVAGLDKGR